MTGLRFECQTGCTACCRQKGFVYLTESDLQRIAKFLRMKAQDFERRYVYRTRNLLRLRMPRHTQCHFLEETGCSIHEVKPTQCRIFPYWPELLEDKKEWRKTAAWCPGIGKGPLIQIQSAQSQATEMRQSYPGMYD